MANLASVMEERARRLGFWSQPAFVVDDRTWTHAEVHRGAAHASALLASVGVGRDARVLIVVGDGIEAVWAFLGTVRLGGLAIPVNPRLTADDHASLAADARPAAVVCAAELADRFATTGVVRSDDLAATVSAALDGGDDSDVPAAAEVGDESPAYAQYTSGTTGRPKAAVHRHADALVYFRAFAEGAIRMTGDDVVLSVSKMFFAYGLGNSLFFPLLSGCRALLDPGPPRPDNVARLVGCHGVTVLFSVPTLYARLVAACGTGEFRSLRVAVSAGEALTAVLAERCRSLLGCPILDGLGSTEVGQTFASNTLDAQRDATVGRALPPYELTVTDEAGRDVDVGQVGTLWVRGPTVLVEYLDRPDATAAVMRGCWLSTADRAAIDADGFVHHRGRVDDIEVVGGINVAPLEIEAVLVAHPSVSEVAVAAVRDPMGASRLEAFVVAGPDAGAGGSSEVLAGDVLARELIALARANLAPHKAPRAVHFVDALPRTPTGKLRRFLLRGDATVRNPGREETLR
ncbi:MAG: AMP-binding protein [Actinomycetota bacterium]|nr:AMP-binding protein [Actinomycetota bacterium]